MLTLLALHGNKELLSKPSWLQVTMLICYYGDDPLTPIAHHMLYG